MSRGISETIKGLLIILVVLGHVHALDYSNGIVNLRDYLYKFHVYCFLILPFFYDSQKRFTLDNVLKAVRKTWIPYTIVLVVCLAVSIIMGRHLDMGIYSLYAFFNGTQTPLARSFGFVFPWFLPAYCSLSLMLLYLKNNQMLMYLVAALSVSSYFLDFQHYSMLKEYLPFAIGLAIYCFAPGFLSRTISNHLNGVGYLGAALFVVLSILYWNGHSNAVISLLLPVTFFLFLIVFAPLVESRVLRSLGNCSLYIYLINVFVINIFNIILPRTLFGGIVNFVCSMLISWGMSIFIMKGLTIVRNSKLKRL